MALNLPVKLAEAKESSSIFLVELYNFYLKTGILYLCAADQDITFGGQLYKAVPIERDVVKSSSDSKVDDTTLRVTNVDDAFTAALYSGEDFRGCHCSIFQILYPEALTDITQVKPVIYGYLDAPILKQKDATFEVTLRSQTPNLSNSRTFKLSCNSEYGDESCGGSLIPATGVCLSNSTRNIIYSPAFTSDATTWKDGIITIGYESRQVIMHGDNCVEVRYPFSFDTVGHSFVINPGCDKSYARCSQWKNTGSYSGFLSIPRELVIRSS